MTNNRTPWRKPPEPPEPQTLEGRQWRDLYKAEVNVTKGGVLLGAFFGYVLGGAVCRNDPASLTGFIVLFIIGFPALALLFRK